MAKKAFLLGANTQGLRYAKNDVTLMTQALSRYEYEVVVPDLVKGAIITKFDEFIDGAAKTDTIIFYFSGHGYTPTGELQLVLNDELQNSKSVININSFTGALSSCQAENKLIILDCCRAGAVSREWNPELSERYRVLTASERLQQGKELDQFQSSFLTYYIHKALLSRYNDIIDEKGSIRINSLYEWLKKQAQIYNAREQDRQVPIPNLLGNQKTNFEVGIVKRVPSNQETVFLFNVRLPDTSEFYGRYYERNALLSQTKTHGSTSIVGLRRIGKTWLLQYLTLHLQAEWGSHTRIGYLDATAPSCATLESFTIAMLKALGASGSLHENSLVALEEFVKIKSKSQLLVLCIDEFEGLGKKPDFELNFFKNMRAIAQAGLVLVTASKSSLYDIVGEPGETSGFFNIFQQLTLTPFTYDEAASFMEEKGQQAGFTEQECGFLLKYGQVQQFKNEEIWFPARLQRAGKILLGDIYLAKTARPGFYRPDDADYWQDFERRLNDGNGEGS